MMKSLIVGDSDTSKRNGQVALQCLGLCTQSVMFLSSMFCFMCICLAESLSRRGRDSDSGADFTSIWSVLWCDDLSRWTAGPHETNLWRHAISTVRHCLLAVAVKH